MRIALLGPLEVHGEGGAPVEVAGARLRTLTILLALSAGRVVSTGALIDGLWAGEPPAGAANALQALVSRLRRATPHLPVESHPTGYRLALDPQEVDLWLFERLVHTGRQVLDAEPALAVAHLDEALALWRGPALADVGTARFARATIARAAELRLAATEDRAEGVLRLGDGPSLVPALEALVSEQPLRERLTGLLMRALAAAERTGDALAAYERLRRRLADEMGADPSPGLAALHLAILRGADPAVDGPAPAADGPARHAPAAEGTAPPRNNLRAGLTSFVGRDDEMARVMKLLGESRLTTLTGPGGAGKTRLAVEAARTQLEQAPDGVWLVELAPVADPAEVPLAVLSVLGLREHAIIGSSRSLNPAEPADPTGRLATALAGKRTLLVLDNCEHLIDAAARLADALLGACPAVRILATSREPLGITGEALWPVEPLALPPLEITAEAAGGYASVRLFVDRAVAVRPGFAVDSQTVAPVIRVCRALDGMPLAIELAAARLRGLTAEQIAGRLDDRFRLLTAGSRTALARHQTLRAVVDWSWDLLDDAERTVWRRLAVFTDGATVAAAERVCAGGPVGSADVLDLLTALVEKSILILAGNGTPRYRMLETIRAYGLERLAEAGEEQPVRAAHAAYFLDLAERAEPALRGAEQLGWLRRLRDDQENLHAAVRWAIGERDPVTSLRLVAALGWYWSLLGLRREGAELAAEALALPGDAPAETLGLAYAMGAMNGIVVHGDGERTRVWFQRAVVHGRRSGGRHPLLRLLPPIVQMFLDPDSQSPATAETFQPLFDDEDPWVRATALMMHAHSQANAGRDDDAERNVLAALATYRRLDERWGISFSLTIAAELASMHGDHPRAARYYEEAISRIGEFGTSEDLTHMQAHYGTQLWLLGEHGRAVAVLRDAERNAKRVGLPEAIATVDCQWGEIAYWRGNLAEARRRYELARSTLDDMPGAPQFRAVINSSVGLIDAVEGDLDSGRERQRTALGLALHSRDRPVVRRVLVNMADVALRAGEPGRAATLLGAAGDSQGRCQLSREDAPRIEAAARSALGEQAFAEAYRRGRELTGEQLRDLTGAVAPVR